MQAFGLNDGPVADYNMPADGGRVSQHRVIADVNIVGYVHVCHHEVVVAERSPHPPSLCTAVDSDKFADFVPVSDDRRGALAFVFQILRRDADGGVRVEDVILADPQRTFHDHVRFDLGSRADLDIPADDRIRPDLGRLLDLGCGIDDGSGMYRQTAQLLPVRKFTKHFRFSDNHAVNTSRTEHLRDRGLALRDLHLDAELIAWTHRFAEFRLFHGRQ